MFEALAQSFIAIGMVLIMTVRGFAILHAQAAVEVPSAKGARVAQATPRPSYAECEEAMPPSFGKYPEIEADFLRTCMDPDASTARSDRITEDCHQHLAKYDLVGDLDVFHTCVAEGLRR